MDEQVKAKLEAMQGDLAKRIAAMERLCEGMTTEDLNQAPFTYLALLQIVQRRENKEQQK